MGLLLEEMASQAMMKRKLGAFMEHSISEGVSRGVQDPEHRGRVGTWENTAEGV